MIRSALNAGALVAFFSTVACAQDTTTTEINRAEVEEIVRAYILENPEIIEEAIIILGERQHADEAEKARLAIQGQSEALYNDARDYSIGPADAELTIVEFFDYRCGYCKASLDWVQALPEQYDGRVRVVFKEFPILSAESEVAARAALAAGQQDLYVEMHAALMRSRSGFKDEDIEALAESVGLDIETWKADKDSVQIRQHVADTRELAKTIGTSATPTFIIDGEFIAGFDRQRLIALIEDKLG